MSNDATQNRIAKSSEQMAHNLGEMVKIMKTFNENFVKIGDLFKTWLDASVTTDEKVTVVVTEQDGTKRVVYETDVNQEELDLDPNEFQYADIGNPKRIPLRFGQFGEKIGEAEVGVDEGGNLIVKGIIPDAEVASRIFGEGAEHFSISKEDAEAARILQQRVEGGGPHVVEEGPDAT